jgi:hypothetical protein
MAFWFQILKFLLIFYHQSNFIFCDNVKCHVLSLFQFCWTLYSPVVIKCTACFFWLALQSLWALASFQFPDLFTIGKTPWTSDQLVARPLPKYRTTQTQNKRIHTPNIHALSGIRIHDHSVRASEDSSCLRPLGYHDRHRLLYNTKFLHFTRALYLRVLYDSQNKTPINPQIALTNLSFVIETWCVFRLWEPEFLCITYMNCMLQSEKPALRNLHLRCCMLYHLKISIIENEYSWRHTPSRIL